MTGWQISRYLIVADWWILRYFPVTDQRISRYFLSINWRIPICFNMGNWRIESFCPWPTNKVRYIMHSWLIAELYYIFLWPIDDICSFFSRDILTNYQFFPETDRCILLFFFFDSLANFPVCSCVILMVFAIFFIVRSINYFPINIHIFSDLNQN